MTTGRHPFVGRRDDVERVRRAIDGRVRLVVIEGEAGIGKTRLIDEALSVRDPGLVVLRGEADRDTVRPLAPLVDALEPSLQALPELSEALRRHRYALGTMFARLASAPPPQYDISPHELHDGIVASLDALLRRRHGALVLDDLHWADADTIAALRRVVRSDIGCTTIVAARHDASPDGLIELLDDVERVQPVVRVQLDALSPADVADLLRRERGALAAVAAGDVFERTGGHPLLLVQLLESGALDHPDLSSLPSSAQESIRRCVVAADDNARAVLNDAAVLGSHVRFDELARLSPLSEHELTVALRRLCDLRLLNEKAPDEFAFNHALTRQVVESTMLARERRAAHRRVLVTLPVDAEPARVLLHALAAGDHALARAAATAGAPLALAAGRVTEARNMAVLATTPDSTDEELLSVLAWATWQLGDRATAGSAAIRALAVAGHGAASAARMRLLLARLAWESMDAEAFRSHLSALQELVAGAAERELPELLTMCAELKMLCADPDDIEWCERAVASARGTPLEPRALLNLGSSLTNEPGRRAEGRRLLRWIVTEGACDSFNHARAMNNLLCDVIYAEHPRSALAIVDEFERHIAQTPMLSVFGAQIPLYRQQCAERLGDRSLAEAALAWFGPVAPEGHTCLAAAAARMELDRGRAGPACRAVHAASLANRDRVDQEKLIWTDAIAVAVEATGAEPVVEPLLDKLFDPSVQPHRYMLDALDARGSSAIQLARRHGEAAALTLTRWRNWVGDDPDAVAITAHLTAIVSEWRGEPDAATVGYLAALDGLPIRTPVVMSDALRGLARCAAASGDRAGAREWARQAVELLANWPGVALDESVRLLRQFGGRPAQSGVDATLSDREREVAVLISRGLTNPQIGTALNISSRTVGVHVRHILDKLNATKRAEIAAHVARQQLAG